MLPSRLPQKFATLDFAAKKTEKEAMMKVLFIFVHASGVLIWGHFYPSPMPTEQCALMGERGAKLQYMSVPPIRDTIMHTNYCPRDTSCIVDIQWACLTAQSQSALMEKLGLQGYRFNTDPSFPNAVVFREPSSWEHP